MTTLGLVEVSRRSQNRNAFRHKVIKNLPKIAPGNRVNASRRFVQQYDFGTMDQRADKPKLLLHPSGELAGEAFSKLCSFPPLKKFRRARRLLSAVDSKKIGVEPNIFVNGQVFVEPKALRHVTQVQLGAFWIANYIKVCDSRGSRVRRHDASQHAKRRSLAGAVRSNQTKISPGRTSKLKSSTARTPGKCG